MKEELIRRNHKIQQAKTELEYVLTHFPIKEGTSVMSQRALEFQIMQLWNEGMMPDMIASKLDCDPWIVENTIECRALYEGVTA